MRAVPAALAYLRDWRSADGLTAPEFNRVGLRRAVDELSAAWSVDAAYHEECLGSMGMVRLPAGLDLSKDVPGQPVGPDSVRSRLRDRATASRRPPAVSEGASPPPHSHARRMPRQA